MGDVTGRLRGAIERKHRERSLLDWTHSRGCETCIVIAALARFREVAGE